MTSHFLDNQTSACVLMSFRFYNVTGVPGVCVRERIFMVVSFVYRMPQETLGRISTKCNCECVCVLRYDHFRLVYVEGMFLKCLKRKSQRVLKLFCRVYCREHRLWLLALAWCSTRCCSAMFLLLDSYLNSNFFLMLYVWWDSCSPVYYTHAQLYTNSYVSCARVQIM